jgi:hypothetical protein
MKRALTKALLALIVALLLAPISCVVTPVPEPPDLDPPDPDLIVLESVMSIMETEVFITGERGAAEPGTTVWVVALASTSPPITETVADDGSFDLRILASSNTELRIQLRSPEGLRSDPVDLVVPPPLEPVRGATVVRDDCLVLDPPYELDLGEFQQGVDSEVSLSIRNGCGSEITIDALELRVPTPSFQIIESPPISIADGDVATVTVRFDPRETGLIEEILFVGVGDPLNARWPVTLFGVGM